MACYWVMQRESFGAPGPQPLWEFTGPPCRTAELCLDNVFLLIAAAIMIDLLPAVRAATRSYVARSEECVKDVMKLNE